MQAIGYDRLEIPAYIEPNQLSDLISWIDHNMLSYKKPKVETWNRPASIEIVIPSLDHVIRNFSLENENSFKITVPEHVHPTDFIVRVTGPDAALYATARGKIIGKRPSLTISHLYQTKRYTLLP